MKKTIIALFLCAALPLCAACSSRMSYESPAAPAPAPAAAAPREAAMDSGGMAVTGGWGNADTEKAVAQNSAAQEESGESYGAKIIKNASISLETREFDAHTAYIRQRADDMGGYVSNSYTSGKKPESYSDSGRYASITVRIPQQRLESFLADARGIATVVSESMSGDDITTSYYDTESRLSVYTTQRDRVLALLSKAETMEDIIALESELSRITYEIESLTTSLRRWDNLVDYSTVTVDLREIAVFSTSASPDSFGTRISEGFAKTLSGLAVFFENLLVFLIVASPVLLLLALITVVVLLLVRRNNRKRAAHMAQQGYAPYTGGYGNATQPYVEKKHKKMRKNKGQPPEGTEEQPKPEA